MLGLKLNHVSKRGHWSAAILRVIILLDISLVSFAHLYKYFRATHIELTVRLNLGLNTVDQNFICPGTLVGVAISLKSKPSAICISRYIHKGNPPWPCNSMKLMFKQSSSNSDLLFNHASGKHVVIYKPCVICIYLYNQLILSLQFHKTER